MPQLASNWPDKSKAEQVRDKSPLIDLEPREIGQQGGTLYESDRERLSEETLTITKSRKRCDSPDPERLEMAFKLWKEGLTWENISVKTGLAERTMRRYFAEQGFKRDYKFVSEKLTGIKRSEETKKKLSDTRIREGISKGDKNWNWKGGLSNPKIQIWNTTEYKLWRTSVFIRDNFTCKGCGIHSEKGLSKTVQLEAHHILPRRDFPHLTFDISNGITLCKTCHDKTRRKEYLSANIWKQRV